MTKVQSCFAMRSPLSPTSGASNSDARVWCIGAPVPRIPRKATRNERAPCPFAQEVPMTQRIRDMHPSPDMFKKPGAGMKSLAIACALLLGVLYTPCSHAAPHAEVKEVMLKDLPDFPGKEGLVLEVLYP